MIRAGRLSPFGEAARLRPENGLAKTGALGVCDPGREIVPLRGGCAPTPKQWLAKTGFMGVCDAGGEIVPLRGGCAPTPKQWARTDRGYGVCDPGREIVPLRGGCAPTPRKWARKDSRVYGGLEYWRGGREVEVCLPFNLLCILQYVFISETETEK